MSKRNITINKNKFSWANVEGNEPNLVKKLLSKLSLKVRTEQFDIFNKALSPQDIDKIVDIGVSTAETLKDTNFFEKIYEYPENITAASIDDPMDFPVRYPNIKFLKINAGQKLPFVNKQFDIAVSWATLEHVGGIKQQKAFLSELFRTGKKVFLTTPYRGCFYEPHSGLPFLHWLPRKYFYQICRLIGKNFWSKEDNIRCLWKYELENLVPKGINTQIIVYKMFGFIPSHLILIKN